MKGQISFFDDYFFDQNASSKSVRQKNRVAHTQKQLEAVQKEMSCKLSTDFPN